MNLLYHGTCSLVNIDSAQIHQNPLYLAAIFVIFLRGRRRFGSLIRAWRELLAAWWQRVGRGKSRKYVEQLWSMRF